MVPSQGTPSCPVSGPSTVSGNSPTVSNVLPTGRFPLAREHEGFIRESERAGDGDARAGDGPGAGRKSRPLPLVDGER